MPYENFIWLVVIGVSIVVEFSTAALVCIWFAVGGILAELLHMAGMPMWSQVLIFVVGSVVCFLVFRKFWKDKVKAKFVPTNADRNIGKTVLVTEDIDNLAGTGEIKTNGQLWTAKTFDDGEKIPVGTKVVIEKIEGSKVYVKKAEDKQPEKFESEGN